MFQRSAITSAIIRRTEKLNEKASKVNSILRHDRSIRNMFYR